MQVAEGFDINCIPGQASLRCTGRSLRSLRYVSRCLKRRSGAIHATCVGVSLHPGTSPESIVNARTLETKGEPKYCRLQCDRNSARENLLKYSAKIISAT